MRKSALFGLSFLMALGTACVDGGLNDPEANGTPADPENWPFYVAMFDHAPNEDEIQTDFERFLIASGETGISVTNRPDDQKRTPNRGQKLVRIAAKTADTPAAGTSQAYLIRFTGTWSRNGGTETEDFVLNQAGRDDLDRNTVSIFYYLLNVTYSSDVYLRGRISTLSEDGWYCSELDLAESNHLLDTRNQQLNFGQAIDYPSNTHSAWKYATNQSSLSYY